MKNKVVATSILLALILIFPSRGQEPASTTPATPIVVSAFVTDKSTKSPAVGLTESDFQVLDNRHPVAVSSFGDARNGTARALSVWFVLLCPEDGISQTPNWNGSNFMKGHAAELTPILRKLGSRDTVGVAHWCDDSSFELDLTPTTDRAAPAAAIEKLIAKPMTPINTFYGEESRLRVVRLVRATAQKFKPDATVVVIFLAGDETLLDPDRAKDMMQPMPELPTIFFVVNNGAALAPNVTPGQDARRTTPSTEKVTANVHQLLQPMLVVATKSGGDSYSSMRGAYGELLDRILTQLEGRYEIAFVPSSLDGKEHDLEVKLAASGQQKVHSAAVHSSQLYFASAPVQDSADLQRNAALSLGMRSNAPLTEIPFDASGRNPGGGQPAQFRLFVDPKALSWVAGENGEVHAELALAMAGISSQGAVLLNQVKVFQAKRTKGEAAKNPQSAVVLTAPFWVPEDAVTVRFVVRDAETGHLGSFDLPVARIKSVPAATPPVGGAPAQH